MKPSKLCMGLRESLVIDAMGNITTCCVDDADFRNYIDNIQNTTLKKAFESEKMKKWRKAQLELDFKNMAPACKDCSHLQELLEKNIKPLEYPDSIIQVDICNLKCKFCAQANPEGPHNNKRGFMEFKVFKKIIDDLVKHNIIFGTFEPFWLGESLMHPEFKKFFSYYLKHKEKISLGWQLDTNGILLTEELSKFIIETNNNFNSKIIFSLDAIKEETYKKIRGKDELKNIIKNIKKFIELRKGYDYPELYFQFILTKDNFKEAKAFTKFWQHEMKKNHIGGTIFLKQKDGGNATENVQLFNKAKEINTESPVPYKKFKIPEKRNTLQVCGAPFKTLIIDKDGNATVCCVDNNLDLKIGNVKEKSIYDLWINNPELNQFRLNILKGIYPKKCQTCDFKNSSNVAGITEKEAKEFLISQGHYEEAKAFKESFIEKKWLRNNWWLTLEINATCNLRCPMCSQSTSWIKGNILTFKQIKELIDALIRDNLTFYSFTPFFRGESLLHPEFTKIINYLTEISHHRLWKVITLHTNATLLTKEKSDALLKMFNSYEEGEMFFSIDAATEETYKKIRVGGNFKQVIKNIEYFIKAKGNLPNPKMVFQFIVMDENYKEALQFYKFWANMLKKYNQKFVLSKFHPRLIPMGEYNTNVIFFRRKERKKDSPETDEHNLKLLKNVYETLKN